MKTRDMIKKLSLSVLATSFAFSLLLSDKADAAVTVTSADAMKNAKKFAAGYFTTLVVKPDGTLWGLGEDQEGELGLAGSTTTAKVATNDTGVKTVTLTKNMYASSTYVKADGSVVPKGLLAINGTVSNVDSASLSNHALVLKTDGTVWSWGSSGWGQLGNGSGGMGYSGSITTPVQVTGLNGVIQVSAGATSSYALKSNGTLWAWGNWDYTNTQPSPTTPKQVMTNVAYVSAGVGYTLVVKTDGTVWGWGANTKGQLGIGSTTATTIPTQVKGVGGSGFLSDIVAVAGGTDASYALTSDGRVYAWGDGFGGRLGDGNTANHVVTTPILISGISDVVGLQAGSIHGLALKSDGTLWGWGGYRGELGLGMYVRSGKPIQVGGMTATPSVPADTTPPVAATLTASITVPTKNDVTVTINYPADGVTKQYKVGSGGTWTTYTGPVVLTANNTIYARSIDSASNISPESNLIVNNIDKTAPGQASFSANPSGTTTDPVVVTITYPADAVTKEYKIGSDGVWTTYTSPVSFTENGTIFARSSDQVGNVSAESSYSVTNIEKSSESFEEATKAVEAAEESPSWDKVNTAQSLIDSLSTSSQKTSLQTRLDAVKSSLNRYESIQEEINFINDLIDQGKMTSALVTQYLSSVPGLHNTVNTMIPVTMDRNHLNTQIDELYERLLLLDAVFKAKNSGDIEDVDLGELQDQIDQLPDGDLKDQLQTELDLVKEKARENATNKVEQAEQSKSQTDVNDARDAVNNLPDGQVKDDLNNRLDEVQKQIDDEKKLADQIADATEKVVKAENSKSQTDVDTAREVVSNLPDGDVKDELNDRLDQIQQQIDDANDPFEVAVKKAETSKSQVDVDAARDLVNTLPEGEKKGDLHERLDAVDAALKNATSKTRQAELMRRNPYISDAVALVTALKDSPAKTVLEERLNALNGQLEEEAFQDQLEKATLKVKQAELMKRDPYITDAWTLVNALREGNEKQGLVDRLNALKERMEEEAYQALLAKATEKVVQAEEYKKQRYIDDAWVLVNQLREIDKQALSDRLKAVEEAIAPKPPAPPLTLAEKIAQIEDPAIRQAFLSFLTTLETAEKYKARTQILSASQKANAIPEEVRNSPLYSAIYQEMNNRLTVLKDEYNNGINPPVEALANATKQVENYEKYKTSFYKKKAQDAVTALPDGLDKDELQLRINAVGK